MQAMPWWQGWAPLVVLPAAVLLLAPLASVRLSEFWGRRWNTGTPPSAI